MGADAFASIADSPISGDYNANGKVEQADLDLVLLNWGAPYQTLPPAWLGEFPGRFIDQEELDRVLLRWGSTHPLVEPDPSAFPTAGVPEPAAWLLVAIAIACRIACQARPGRGEQTR